MDSKEKRNNFKSTRNIQRNMRTCHAACGRQQQMEYAQCTGTGLSGDIWCAGIFLHFRVFVRRQYENLAGVLEAESDDTFFAMDLL